MTKEKMVAMPRTTKASVPGDVDDYLRRLPRDKRAALEKLRRTIKSIAPTAIETISYQIPTFKLDGRMLVSYAGFSDHCSFFPGAGPIEAHKRELQSYQTSKGTIRFTVDEPLPVTLVTKLVKTRIKLNQESIKKLAISGRQDNKRSRRPK